MGTLILEVAALGVAVSLTSPGSVVTVIALLSMSSGVRRGLAFIAGWVLAIGVIALLMVFVLQGQNFHSPHTTPSRAASAAEVLFGCVLLITAVRAYHRPRYAPKNASPPKWLARVDRSHWSVAIVVGAVMLSYALTLTAAAETLKANVSYFEASAAGLVFAVTSILTVTAPLVIVAVAPERASTVLATARDWVVAHSRPILLIALMLIGAAVMVKGAYDLTA